MKMIKLTKLNGQPTYINAEKVLSLDSATTKKGVPATVVKVGIDIWVKETAEEIMKALGFV